MHRGTLPGERQVNACLQLGKPPPNGCSQSDQGRGVRLVKVRMMDATYSNRKFLQLHIVP